MGIKIIFKLGMVVNTYNASYLGDGGKRTVSSRSAWAKTSKTCIKNKIKTKY
jgi:hypothetical protein